MTKAKQNSEVSLLEAAIVIGIVLLTLGIPLILIPNLAPHVPLISAIVLLLLYGLTRSKMSFSNLQAGMINSVSEGMGAIYLFFFIGILIASLMFAGSIATLMHAGLKIISCKLFYLAVFVLTAILGVSIGSSLTTVATLGVALLGLARALDLNQAITTGAIVSGAFFGDKMSPLSDTTSLAAGIVGIDLFTHIKNMLSTTVPGFIISALFFASLSPFNTTVNSDVLNNFDLAITKTGLVHWSAFIPLIALIMLSLLRLPSVISLILVSAISLIIGNFLHPVSLSLLGDLLFSGFKSNSLTCQKLSPDIVNILDRGGINSMFFSITIVILALSLGGLLFTLGIIPTILQNIQTFLKTRLQVTLAVAITAISVNLIVGEQYLSILLAGKTFVPVYKRLDLPRKFLARTLEDAGTVINPLVPWSVCGVFISNILSVKTVDYAPFAIFCYISVWISLSTSYKETPRQARNK